MSFVFSAYSRTWFVDQKNQRASDKGVGSNSLPFKTISPAAARARAGDTVLILSGIYRERVAPAQGGTPHKPIVYRAGKDQTVSIRGSEVVSQGITSLGEDVYRIACKPSSFSCMQSNGIVKKYNPFAVHRSVGDSLLTLGQVFVDGIPLIEVARAYDVTTREGTFCAVDSGKAILVHSQKSMRTLSRALVEISVRHRIFAPFTRGTSYITLDGLVLEHCANQYPENFYMSQGPPQEGALGFRGGNHWIVRNCTIRFAKTIGIDCGIEGVEDGDSLHQRQQYRAGYHIIEKNTIVDNGAAGIVGLNPRATFITGNYIERNNREGFVGMEGGGIKLHNLTDGLIMGNVIRDNGICGLWLDNGASRSRVTRNTIVANVGAGIFMELGRDSVIIDNNIIALTMIGGNLAGDGIYSHDACNVHIVNNLIYGNANFGIWNHIGTDRVAQVQDQASHWRVYNNLIAANFGGSISFPPATQHSSDNLSDYNAFTGPYNRISLETWGAPYDVPFFMVNTNKGRFTQDSLEKRVAAANGLPQSKVLDSAALLRFRAFPSLLFLEWKKLTHQDAHSIVPVMLRSVFSRFDLMFECTLSEAMKRVGCPVFSFLDKDFNGTPYNTSLVVPGPFQNLVYESALLDTSTYATPNRGLWEKLVIPEKNKNRCNLIPVLDSIPSHYLTIMEKSIDADRKRYEPKVFAANIVGSKENPREVLFFKDSAFVLSKTALLPGIKSLGAPYEGKAEGMLTIAWNTQGLYGSAKVPDTRIREDKSYPPNGDCIELYFQTDGVASKIVNQNSIGIWIAPVRGVDTCLVWVKRDTVVAAVESIPAHYTLNDTSGYILNFFIPASVFAPGKLSAGTHMPFTYCIGNRGEPLEQFYCNKEFDESLKKPLRWGTIILGKQ